MDKHTDKEIAINGEPVEDRGEGTFTSIYIEPAREAAVRWKFDIYVVPVSVIYLVLSTLDRNNVISPPSCRYEQFLISEAWKRPRLWL
jgi:hypothetical protein